MPLVRVLKHWGEYADGEVVDITDAAALIAEGKAELVDVTEAPVIEPVQVENPEEIVTTQAPLVEAPIETPETTPEEVTPEIPVEVPTELPVETEVTATVEGADET